jgi:hypothetical protein
MNVAMQDCLSGRATHVDAYVVTLGHPSEGVIVLPVESCWTITGESNSCGKPHPGLLQTHVGLPTKDLTAAGLMSLYGSDHVAQSVNSL